MYMYICCMSSYSIQSGLMGRESLKQYWLWFEIKHLFNSVCQVRNNAFILSEGCSSPRAWRHVETVLYECCRVGWAIRPHVTPMEQCQPEAEHCSWGYALNLLPIIQATKNHLWKKIKVVPNVRLLCPNVINISPHNTRIWPLMDLSPLLMVTKPPASS